VPIEVEDESDSESDDDAPKSTLDRERKMKTRTAKRRRVKAKNSTKVSLEKRIQEFKGEPLMIASNQLMCKACVIPLTNKKSSLDTHFESGSHKEAKRRVEEKAKRQRVLEQHFESLKYAENRNASSELKARRLRVVRSMLASGVPLHKIDFDEFLEFVEDGQNLGARSTLLDYIPTVVVIEKETIKREITPSKTANPTGSNTLFASVTSSSSSSSSSPSPSSVSESSEDPFVSVIFDGVTHVTECIAIILRFLLDGFIQHRLACLRLLPKSPDAPMLAKTLMAELMQYYRISEDRLLMFMHDRASVNTAAFNLISFNFPQALDWGCWSHTISNAGECFKTPNVTKLISGFKALTSRSKRAPSIFKEHFKMSPISPSETRYG